MFRKSHLNPFPLRNSPKRTVSSTIRTSRSGASSTRRSAVMTENTIASAPMTDWLHLTALCFVTPLDAASMKFSFSDSSLSLQLSLMCRGREAEGAECCRDFKGPNIREDITVMVLVSCWLGFLSVHTIHLRQQWWPVLS